MQQRLQLLFKANENPVVMRSKKKPDYQMPD